MIRKLFTAALLATAAAAAAAPTYVTTSWNTNTLHILDENMVSLSNFAAAAQLPNGIAADANRIFSAHFTNNTVYAYNHAGAVQYSFGIASNAQGLAYTSATDEVAVASLSNIVFYNATTGAFTRQFASSGSTVEGLTVHNGLLWEIGNTLIARDLLTGAAISNIANAASGCSFGGTGIATAGAGQLKLACTSGQWFTVSDVTGAVINSGNNGLDMFGLDDFATDIVVPEPAALALLGMGLLGLAGLRRRKA